MCPSKFRSWLCSICAVPQSQSVTILSSPSAHSLLTSTRQLPMCTDNSRYSAGHRQWATALALALGCHLTPRCCGQGLFLLAQVSMFDVIHNPITIFFTFQFFHSCWQLNPAVTEVSLMSQQFMQDWWTKLMWQWKCEEINKTICAKWKSECNITLNLEIIVQNWVWRVNGDPRRSHMVYALTT